MINSKRKGAVGERELASKLREYGFKGARRSQQYCGKGEDSADVVDALPGIHIECKRNEHLNVYDAINQAKRDAKKENLPTVFWRKNNSEWLVTMPLEDWMTLFLEYFSSNEFCNTLRINSPATNKSQPQTKYDNEKGK